MNEIGLGLSVPSFRQRFIIFGTRESVRKGKMTYGYPLGSQRSYIPKKRIRFFGMRIGPGENATPRGGPEQKDIPSFLSKDSSNRIVEIEGIDVLVFFWEDFQRY